MQPSSSKTLQGVTQIFHSLRPHKAFNGRHCRPLLNEKVRNSGAFSFSCFIFGRPYIFETFQYFSFYYFTRCSQVFTKPQIRVFTSLSGLLSALPRKIAHRRYFLKFSSKSHSKFRLFFELFKCLLNLIIFVQFFELILVVKFYRFTDWADSIKQISVANFPVF